MPLFKIRPGRQSLVASEVRLSKEPSMVPKGLAWLRLRALADKGQYRLELDVLSDMVGPSIECGPSPLIHKQ